MSISRSVNNVLPQPGRSVSDTQLEMPIIPASKDNLIRAALVALCFTLFAMVLAVVAYFGYSGVFDNLVPYQQNTNDL